MTIDFSDTITRHLANIRALEKQPGIYTASAHSVGTGYDRAWLRDLYFIVLSFLEVGEIETVRRSARALLNVFLKHRDKIDWAIKNKPQETWQYVHARFHPESFEEFWEEWGNRQNDAVGEVLNLLCELELRGVGIAESDEDKEMVQKIVDYLVRLEYWQDRDNGIWEENLEVHASSIGSVLAALRKAREITWLKVPEEAIKQGETALHNLLPRESHEKFADLALLSLIYPFRVTTAAETDLILRNVEYHLTRERGVIRYKGDRYYNNNSYDGWSEEAEWCFGLAWLAIIYAERGERDLARHYLELASATVTKEGLVPELYYSHTNTPNPNTPLGWAESMYVIALHKVRQLG